MVSLPEVSIAIISHNEERNIKDCLESVLSLDYPMDNIEVIVVDSSYDRTREIIKSFQNVQLIETESKNRIFRC